MFLIPKASQTTFIYGPTVYKNLIPEDTILYKINQVIDFSFVNEACSDLYSLDNGRPVKNTPEMMFRSAIIQYLNDFSDRQMEEAARYNLIIKWFIGIPVEDSSYDHSALGDFRDRLGEKRWKKLFFIILKQIEDAGFAKGNQSVDATHVIANIAIPGTIGLIRQGIKVLMEEIETVDPKLFEELGGKKTADKKKKLHTLKPEEKKTKLVDVVEEARAIRDKAEKLESSSVKQKIEQLNQILNENIEEKNGKVQKKKEHVKNKLVSLVDEKTKNSSKPKKVRGDTHYGGAENRFHMLQRGITVVAPIQEDFNPTGLLSQDKFILDKTGVTCLLKDQCTKQEGMTITIGKHHDLVMEAKEYNKTQDFKDDMKERAHIEPKNAEMKRFHGMARARYCGLPKVNVQFIITAIVVNVKRLANVIGSVCYLKAC